MGREDAQSIVLINFVRRLTRRFHSGWPTGRILAENLLISLDNLGRSLVPGLSLAHGHIRIQLLLETLVFIHLLPLLLLGGKSF